MRAIVIKQYGGPEVLAIEERADPKPKPGHVVVDVKAFGLNHAEIDHGANDEGGENRRDGELRDD